MVDGSIHEAPLTFRPGAEAKPVPRTSAHALWRLPWLALIIASLVAIARGLDRTFYFEPTGEALARARTGTTMIIVGSLALLAAAAWGTFHALPRWIVIFVSLPAFLCGAESLVWDGTLLPHLSAFVALPLALTGAVAGVVAPSARRRRAARGQRRL
jgi:hypothetical protein